MRSLLFGQKSTNLTIFFLVLTVLIILLMDVRNIISFANIKNNYLRQMMKYETVIFCLIMSQDFQKITVKVKVELFD